VFNWWLLFWWAVSVVAVISYLLLSYAFRDISFLLAVQSCLTFLGLVIPTILLTKHYNPQPNVVFVTEDEVTGDLSHWYQYTKEEERDNQACGFFDSCR
jgi:hypothetical protein